MFSHRAIGRLIGFIWSFGETGLLSKVEFLFFYSPSLYVVFQTLCGVEMWEKGIGWKFGFVAVCCFVCQRSSDWAFMPVFSKALLQWDMCLEIDWWADRDRQPATHRLTIGKQKRNSVYCTSALQNPLLSSETFLKLRRMTIFPHWHHCSGGILQIITTGFTWIIFYTCYLSFSVQRR